MSKRTRPGATPETDAVVRRWVDSDQLSVKLTMKCMELESERDEARDENKKLREEVEDLKARYRSAMMDRDSYRFQAEQKYAMRRELEELLGIDHGAPGDEQFKKGLKALKAVVRKAKLYDKKN